MPIEYVKYKKIEEVDISSLKYLIMWGFNKKLTEDYEFDKVTDLYIAKNDLYHGAIIGMNLGQGVLYIDKWVVSPPHQKNGIAKKLFDMASEEYKNILLRANVNNETANARYKKLFGEPEIISGWNIYCLGEKANTHEIKEYAATKKITLEEIK